MVILESPITRKMVADSVNMLILPLVVWLLHLFFRKTKWLLRELVVAGYWLAGARRRVGPRGTSLPGGAEEPGKQMTVHVRESIKIHVSHCWRLSESSSTSDDTLLYLLVPPIFFFTLFFLLLFTVLYSVFRPYIIPVGTWLQQLFAETNANSDVL